MSIGIETIFSQAIDLSSDEERDSFLARECGGNSELRRQVEIMLSDYAKGDFLEARNAAQTQTQTKVPSAMEKVNSSIGPYTLLEKIGEGGMGIVFVAEQIRPVRRKVALKIIKPGMDTEQVIARFEAERQALALMNHPNIAKILDAGATDSERLYFVMELVKGIPITEYCDTHKLSTRERLELLLIVCDALQHAHQKGIIHRDIKPGNLLVELHDVRPVPKVVDFGIAKSTNQRLTERSLYTNFSQMIGTPLYMSPEQAQLNGLDVDTRSDVYSLGVLMYELITGTTPFTKESMSRISYDEIRRRIQHDEPPRPSDRISTLKAEALSTLTANQRVDPRQLKKRVQNELDWVVMKALEKDRTRRYQSATALAEDIQRYLNDEPVLACPPSWSYRMSKLVKRYRTPIAVAATVIMTMMTATLLSIWFAIDANSSRAAMKKERDKTSGLLIETEAAAKILENLKSEAERSGDILKRKIYFSNMRLASTDFQTGNIAQLHRLLKTHIPAHEENDLRGWEWYYLWAASNQESIKIPVHKNSFVNWSPDGTKISSIGVDRNMRIWDASKGTLDRTIQLDSLFNYGAIWSPDSKRIAWSTGDERGGVRIWDSESNKIATVYWEPLHGRQVFSVDWSRDGRWLVTGAQNGLLRIYDVELMKDLNQLDFQESSGTRVAVTNHEIRSTNTDYDAIWGVKFNPDSTLVATTGIGNGGVCIWNRASGEIVHQLARRRQVYSKNIAFSNDGKYFLTGDNDGNCEVWDVQNGTLQKSFSAHHGSLSAIAAHPNRNSFLTGGSDGVIRHWNLPNCEPIGAYYGHEGHIASLSWNPNAEQFVSGSSDDAIGIWSVTDNRIPQVMAHNERPTKPNSSELSPLVPEVQASLSPPTELKQDTEELESVRSLLIRDDAVPNDEIIQNYIKQSKNTASLRPVTLERFHAEKSQFLLAIVWSSDRTKLLTVRYRPDLLIFELWNADNPQGPKRVTPSPIDTFDVCWSPDNSKLAIASHLNYEYAAVEVFESSTGKLVRRWIRGAAAMTKVIWNRSGTRVFSGNVNGEVFQWDVALENVLATVSAHQLQVADLAVSLDDKRIASISVDGQVKIFDTERLEELIRIPSGNPVVRQIRWSSDGRKLEGHSQGVKVAVWDASPGFEYVQSDRFRKLLDAEKGLETSKSQKDSHVSIKRLIDSREYETAIQFANDILSHDPNHPEVLFYRAMAKSDLGQHDSAFGDYQLFIRLFPNHKGVAAAWHNIGETQANMKKGNDAIESYSTSIELSTEHRIKNASLIGRAGIYREKNQLVQALADYQSVLENYGSLRAGTAAAELRRELYGSDAYHDAIRKLLDLAAKSTNDTDRRYVLWSCHGKLPRDILERGLELAKEFYTKIDRFPEAGRWLAYSYYRLDQYRETYDYLSKSTDRIESHPSVWCWYWMSMTCEKLGMHEKAEEWLEQAEEEYARVLDPAAKPDRSMVEGLPFLRAEARAVVYGVAEAQQSAITQ